MAGVDHDTFTKVKLILDAVAEGTLPLQTVADINDGTKSIHGVAESLKRTTDKPARKAKSGGWQTAELLGLRAETLFTSALGG